MPSSPRSRPTPRRRSVVDLTGSLLGVGLDLGLEGILGHLIVGVSVLGLGLVVHHLLLGILYGHVEVILGHISGRADGVEHLLLHLSTGLLGHQSQLLNTSVGLLTQLGDLGVQLVVDEPLGVLVHLGTLILHGLGTLLTLLYGTADGTVELVLVGLLEGSDLLATRLGLGSLSGDGASELLNLGISLLVVVSDGLGEAVDLILERLLGLTDVVHSIETHAAGGSLHLGVLRSLGILLLLQGSEHSPSLALQLVHIQRCPCQRPQGPRQGPQAR